MAKRKAKGKAKPAQFHPVLAIKKAIVWGQKWNTHRVTTARKLNLESRKATAASRAVKLAKAKERDAARLTRIQKGAAQDQARTAPQTVRVRVPSAASQARAGQPTTARVMKPRKAPAKTAQAPAQAGASPVGLCGHRTEAGTQCTHPVTKGGTCAAGHNNGMVRQVAGQPSAWAAKPANRISASAGPSAAPAANPYAHMYDGRGQLLPQFQGDRCGTCGMYPGQAQALGRSCRKCNPPRKA